MLSTFPNLYGLIVERRARKLQKPALPDNGHRRQNFFNFGPLHRERSVCDFFNHSSSILSWPICWYSSASSSSRAFSCCGQRLEKSSGSCSIRWFRHNRIWLGWTLNSLAIWVIVFSPLAALKATLALKAASYVFLILGKHTKPPSEIWQAQNPLIPPVQFLGSSSHCRFWQLRQTYFSYLIQYLRSEKNNFEC